VDAQIQDLTQVPGTKWPTFISRRGEGSLYIPRIEQRSNCVLIATQDLHIDILMLSSLPPQEEIDGPSSRNPPRNKQRRKEGRDIVRTPGLPSAQWMCFIGHR
jgi:hypothetical protein